MTLGFCLTEYRFDTKRKPQINRCPIDMKWIPARTNVGLGSPHSILDKPHRTNVQDLCMDIYEMSIGRYMQCVRSSICDAPSCTRLGEEFPVTCVTAIQAEKACAFENKRLPTADVWEFAARGSDGREYPWGNYPYNYFGDIVPVGARHQDTSPFGVKDLGSNVLEWTSSENYSKPGDRLITPGLSAMRSYDFGSIDPLSSKEVIGFRCVRTIE